MKTTPRIILALVSAAVLSMGIAACGSSSSSSSDTTTSSSTASAGASSATVSVKSVSGVGDVLVDAKGNALYSNDQDSATSIKCSGQCASIWVPVSASAKPTSDDASVQGMLGTVSSPGGGAQVTYNGKPLYTFSQDSPGQVNGNGVSDSFAGVNFTWTVASSGAAASGSASSAGTTTSSSSSSGGSSGSSGSGGGNYGY
jgi:predicted lipoprotein with Yx(FWY)xxD motif